MQIITQYENQIFNKYKIIIKDKTSIIKKLEGFKNTMIIDILIINIIFINKKRNIYFMKF